MEKENISAIEDLRRTTRCRECNSLIPKSEEDVCRICKKRIELGVMPDVKNPVFINA